MTGTTPGSRAIPPWGVLAVVLAAGHLVLGQLLLPQYPRWLVPLGTVIDLPVDEAVAEGGVPENAVQATQRAFRSAPRGVLLHFWAPWCHTCLPELQGLADAGRELVASRGVELVTVVPADTEPDDVRRALTKHHAAELAWYPDSPATLSDALRVETLPSTVLLDTRGRIVAEHVGALQDPAAWVAEVMP